MNPSAHRYRLTRRQRLHGRRQFDAVFDARCRKNVGPLALNARPNDLGYNRIGLIVPRRVGKAVRRNHIKRLIREAYRLLQHELPAGYDIAVILRPHEPMALEDYQRLLRRGIAEIDREWQKRRRRRERDRPTMDPPETSPKPANGT